MKLKNNFFKTSDCRPDNFCFGQKKQPPPDTKNPTTYTTHTQTHATSIDKHTKTYLNTYTHQNIQQHAHAVAKTYTTHTNIIHKACTHNIKQNIQSANTKHTTHATAYKQHIDNIQHIFSKHTQTIGAVNVQRLVRGGDSSSETCYCFSVRRVLRHFPITSG